MLPKERNPNFPSFATLDECFTVHLRNCQEQTVQDAKTTAFKRRVEQGFVPRRRIRIGSLLLSAFLILFEETINGRMPRPNFMRHGHVVNDFRDACSYRLDRLIKLWSSANEAKNLLLVPVMVRTTASTGD